MLRTYLLLVLGFCVWAATSALAQDRRPFVAPRVTDVCQALAAPLRAIPTDHWQAAPRTTKTQSRTERHSEFSRRLTGAGPGKAVELALGFGADRHAFLLEPITVPPGVSLIVDPGVTVYATRDPSKFQNPAEPKIVCGTVGRNYPVTGGCLALITLASESGIYGRGVLDGQGQRDLIRDGHYTSGAWWDLLVQKQTGAGCGGASDVAKNGCQQASPPMISAGFLAKEATGHDLTLQGITIRNPPFHTVRVAGDGITIWNVTVQAPWNVPNSDGFDVQGRDILMYDNLVANGDQDVAVVSTDKQITQYLTIYRLTAYGKGGVALLDAGKGIAHVRLDDMAMTGDVASLARRADTVLVNGVDVLRAPLRGTTKHLVSYGQALPTATNTIQGLQINWNTNTARALQPGPVFDDIAYHGVCLQDVVRPIHLGPLQPYSDKQQPVDMPHVNGVVFHDVHVLTPTAQFPSMTQGVVTPGVSGTYTATFLANPNLGFYLHFILDNVVFDDLPSHTTSLATLDAVGDVLSTMRNVYPSALNALTETPAPYAGWTTGRNRYEETTHVSDPGRAFPCPAARWPFLTGSLSWSRENALDVHDSDLMLRAVVQPAMSQTTWFVPGSYRASPGLLAVGSPALKSPVLFYDGLKYIGAVRLWSNGTLASLVLRHDTTHMHIYSALYPGDSIYKPFFIGVVYVPAQ